MAEHSEFLRGRHVFVLPDNDEAGRKHAQQVAQSLHGIAESVRIVELPGLPDKGDVSDWIAAGGTKDELKRLAEARRFGRRRRSRGPKSFRSMCWIARLPDTRLARLCCGNGWKPSRTRRKRRRT